MVIRNNDDLFMIYLDTFERLFKVKCFGCSYYTPDTKPFFRNARFAKFLTKIGSLARTTSS